MNNDQHAAWEELRDQAASHLRPDFHRQVVQQAVRQRQWRRQQPRLALATALVLFLVVNAVSWWKAREAEKQQMAQWEQWQNFQQVVLTAL